MVAHVALVKEPDLEPDIEAAEPEVVGEEGDAAEADGGDESADKK